jgi:hypothetical protein
VDDLSFPSPKWSAIDAPGQVPVVGDTNVMLKYAWPLDQVLLVLNT